MRRINLLPQEVQIRRRQRRQTGFLIAVGVFWVLLLAAIWLVLNGRINEQEERLAVAEARIAELEQQKAALQEFADLELAVKTREQNLQVAMANDIAWSRFLIELSMVIPGDAWLTTFQGTAAAPVESPPFPGEPAGLIYGSVNFGVTSFDFPGVAKWLDRMNNEFDSLVNVWVPSATKSAIGSRDVVTYTSQANLSSAALSQRYQPGGPQ